jgi:hypothetical protein
MYKITVNSFKLIFSDNNKYNSFMKVLSFKVPEAQTHMDLWNSAMGDSLQLQHRNPPVRSIQNSPFYSERTSVHKQPQDP